MLVPFITSRFYLKRLCAWVGSSPRSIGQSVSGLPRQDLAKAACIDVRPHVRFYCKVPKKRHAFTSSMFSAGMTRKRFEFHRARSPLLLEAVEHQPKGKKTNIIVPDRPLSHSEWEDIRKNFGESKSFEEIVMNKIVKNIKDVNVAKSFLSYLVQRNGTLSYHALMQYLFLCVSGEHHTEVMDTYDIMKSCFKTFEFGTATLIIKGLGKTDRWRDAITFFYDRRRDGLVSIRDYCGAISAATSHGEVELGFKIYDEILQDGQVPSQKIWENLFRVCINQCDHEEKLLSMLLYMRDNQIYPKESLIRLIKSWFESLPGQKWRGEYTFAVRSGECHNCKTKLESIELTEEEYAQLKDHVKKNVIEKSNVYIKTNPEELERFKKFMQESGPFDLVVDSLNVSKLSKNRESQSQTLLMVIQKLKKRFPNILVLGRKHMVRKHKDQQNMDEIRKIAQCFFTENISDDDGFLLYAALYSNIHCKFLTRDLMRNHKASMQDPVFQRLFFKWQRGHQMSINYFTPSGKFGFEEIQSFDTIIQKTCNSWHIPFDDSETERTVHEIPQKWLCLTRVSPQDRRMRPE
ncbi:hypothetical protein DNTS_033485 [Danionella cerebrum]|uniref:Mitochondrial ribonuclease P catalytic subunit n=1 Tax=Danionella cerebrum TaxID=2873325 RepID=A0A553PE10_9TELE|nr:hypothetical protein DNTS_033485 [Danionella translucida]